MTKKKIRRKKSVNNISRFFFTISSIIKNNIAGMTIYSGGAGIYCENGGESWENFNVGLPKYEIKALAVSPTTPPTILTGNETVNHGVWVYTDTTVGVDNYELRNYPNPFNPETTISFTLQKRQRVSLCLYNLKGERVRTIFKGRAEKGKSSFTLKEMN